MPGEKGERGGVESVNGQTGAVEIDAEDVGYDSSESGLSSTDIQAAIDELAGQEPEVATTDSPGVVQLAVASDFRGGTDASRALVTGEVNAAMAVVALADAQVIA